MRSNHDDPPRSRAHSASLTALCLVSAALATAAPAAKAADGEFGVGVLSELVDGVLGSEVLALPGGMYEVVLPGGNLVTHGPDPRNALVSYQRGQASAGGVGFAPGDAERRPVCATDYYQHVLYANTTYTSNRFAQFAGEIQAAVRRMNAVLNRDAILSGGLSADYKVLCDAKGDIRVDSITARSAKFDDVVAAARAAGFGKPNADYTIFVDASSEACGVGSYQADERLLGLNQSNGGGGYAAIYRDCWFGNTAMHENGHAQGAVQYGAPNSTGLGGHCNDTLDVMCYSPDGGNLRQGGTVKRCTAIHFDCGFDDYFDVGPEPGEYLSRNWNLGSSLNRFIRLGPPTPSVPPGGGGDSNAVAPIQAGRAVTNPSPAAGSWRLFSVNIPRGLRMMRVMLRPQSARERQLTGNLDLFVRRGSRPTAGRFECRSGGSGAQERCELRVPPAGRWYAGVYAAAPGAGGKFTVRVSLVR